MPSPLITLTWAITVAITIFGYQRVAQYAAYRSKRRQTGCFRAPMYPHTDRLGGSDLFKQRQQAMKDGNLQALYTRHFKALGKTWEEVFWNQRVVNTMDAVNHQYIHALGFEDFGKPNQRMSIAAPILGNGIFVAEGEHWKYSRGMIKPIFARAELENMEMMEKHVDRFMDLLPRDSGTFDIQPMLKKMMLDLSTEFLFGESVDAQTPEGAATADKFLQALDESLAGWHKRRSAGLLHLRYHFDKSWPKAYKKLYAFIDNHVHRALELTSPSSTIKTPSSDRYVLLYEMAKQTRDPTTLRFELINVFLPSRDTTAAVLSNIFFQLSRHPHYWSILRESAKTLPLDTPLTFAALKSLTAFRHIIQETFRTLGPAGRVFRSARHDTTLPRGGGPDGSSPVFIAKGTTVCSLTYHIHHDADIWGVDVNEFRPERWAEGNVQAWGFVPFLGGPRICPAQQQVLVQATYVLLRVVREFEGIECQDEMLEYVELQRMAIESRRGVKIALVSGK